MLDASSVVQELHDAALKSRTDETSAVQEKVAGIVGQLSETIENAPAETPEPAEKTASQDEALDTRADDLLMAGVLVFAEADAIRRSSSPQQD